MNRCMAGTGIPVAAGSDFRPGPLTPPQAIQARGIRTETTGPTRHAA